MKKLMILTVLVMLCGVVGCGSSTSNDSSIDPDLVGTWYMSLDNNGYERIVVSSSGSFTRYRKKVTNENYYSITSMEGTFSTNTSTNPKTLVAAYNYTKKVYINGQIDNSNSETSSGSETRTSYYKIENSKFYNATNSSSWTGADIYTKQ